jgi:exodeoxyribonuclease VII small subunit
MGKVSVSGMSTRKKQSPAGDHGQTGEAPFEASLERLTDIVDRLENGELGLEESLALFEEGVRLARHAQERLDAAEKRVEELIAVDQDGEPVSRELEPE